MEQKSYFHVAGLTEAIHELIGVSNRNGLLNGSTKTTPNNILEHWGLLLSTWDIYKTKAQGEVFRWSWIVEELHLPHLNASGSPATVRIRTDCFLGTLNQLEEWKSSATVPSSGARISFYFWKRRTVSDWLSVFAKDIADDVVATIPKKK